MIFGNDRDALRRQWFEVYRKAQAGETLTPLERQLGAVISQHREYHALLAQPGKYAQRDYIPEFGETNPFLHMGLHVGLHEQISTDRPAGIAALYQQALLRHGDVHVLEHMMIDVLAEMIWRSQREQKAPDEKVYLQMLKERVLKSA